MIMNFILALLITSLANIVLAKEQKSPFWLAKVKVKCRGTQDYCLGAIIEDNFIITTASCIMKCGDSAKMIISVSKYSTGKTNHFEKKVKVDKVIIHPEYNISESLKKHDVALVKFECPNFRLAKVSLNDSCSTNSGLSVLYVNETSEISSTWKCRIAAKEKKCKQAYKSWDDSQHICMIASSCSNKSDNLIVDNQHGVLYGFPSYASECDDNDNTLIAALELCKYYQWIKNITMTAEQCTEEPSPLPGCTAPASIANGDVRYKSLSTGSKALYKCDRGYTMIGNRKIKCVGSSWDKEPPKCVNILACGDPPLHNAKNMNIDIPDSLTEGAKVKYTCPARYKLVGDNVLKCKSGKWVGEIPYCKDCPEFGDVSNGKVIIALNITIHLTVQIKCNTGYSIKGASLNYCINGKWKAPKATCKANKCPVPKNIPNGSVKTTGLTYTSIAIYKCNKGYLISGFQQRKCNDDGTWAGTPPQCRRREELFCKQFDRISCGSTANIGGLNIGAMVIYTPDSNSQLVGASKIECMPNGEWSASAPMCRRMCTMPSLENGKQELIMKNDTTAYDMKMSCDKGFDMIGVEIVTCNNGLWNRTPSNTKCTKPCSCPKIKNGKASCSNLSSFLIINVKCNDGFKPENIIQVVCSEGTYFSPIPTCEK